MNDERKFLLEDEPDIAEVWTEVERAIDDGTYCDELLTVALCADTALPPALAIKLEGYLLLRQHEGNKHDKNRAARQRKRNAATAVELAMRTGGNYRDAMDKAMEQSGLSERTIQKYRAKIYRKTK